MKTFKFTSDYNEVCPICGKPDAEDSILIPILEEGIDIDKNVPAKQVHVKCLVSNCAIMPSFTEKAIIWCIADYFVPYEKS